LDAKVRPGVTDLSLLGFVKPAAKKEILREIPQNLPLRRFENCPSAETIRPIEA